jgi:alpha-D-ribose 1-methylphosphonate 5-triphosphate synthase subunit PhnL
MAETVKVKAAEVALSNTASNVSRASLVRVLNTNAAAQLVTIKDGSSTVGTVTVNTGEVLNIRKGINETLEVGNSVTGVKAVKLAQTH